MKKHNINQSCLYKLSNKKKLFNSILDLSSSRLNLLTSNKLYKEFNIDRRFIEEPINELRYSHDRLFRYLSRITTPDYLFTSVKERSSVSNAKYHEGINYVIISDISKFYPSTKSKYINNLFIREFKMAPDIAYLLKEITTKQDHIPTGSPISQILAFMCHKVLFDEINQYCISHKIKFSLYVDDMTFSSTIPFAKDFLYMVKKILKKHELTLHKRKTISIGKNKSKKITGCYINNDGIVTVPNSLRKKVIDQKKLIDKLFKAGTDNNLLINRIVSTIGIISYCETIEPHFMHETKKSIQKIHNLVKNKY